jgi:cobalt/nickel transport system permease protein
MSGVHRLRSYQHVDSPLHRARASLKVSLTLAIVIAIAWVPVDRAGWVAAVLAGVVLLTRMARVPLSTFAGRIAIAEPFILGVAVLALFQGRGLTVFLAIALKSTTCVAAVQLLTHTTSFPDILDVLHRARLPALLVHTLALLHRYLFVLVDEMHRMRRARAARTWQSRRWGTWSALSSVIAAAFVRSAARAERVYAAMRARGWS